MNLWTFVILFFSFFFSNSASKWQNFCRATYFNNCKFYQKTLKIHTLNKLFHSFIITLRIFSLFSYCIDFWPQNKREGFLKFHHNKVITFDSCWSLRCVIHLHARNASNNWRVRKNFALIQIFTLFFLFWL